MKIDLAIGLWNLLCVLGFMFGVAKIVDSENIPVWAKWLLGIIIFTLAGILLISSDD